MIGGIADNTRYYLGMLGLNPKSTRVSANDSGQSSYIVSLKAQDIIPSISFGFTAGAAYREFDTGIAPEFLSLSR